ncbi:MAG: hypothetical protein MJY87_02485 [Fibrobacter sp.]|nr:hypothetical protein [Fibrobacter sp.]
MVVPKDRFWAKVLFKEFIRHYRKLSDEEIVTDVKQSMDDLDDLNECGNTFGSKMVRWSLERANTPSAEASRANGSKGGRPAKKNNDQEAHTLTSANGSQLDAASGNTADDRKVPPSSTTLVADADTREGSENCRNTGDRANLESGTSPNTIGSAEAPTGNEGDELAMAGNSPLVPESATSTVPNHIPPNPQKSRGGAVVRPPRGRARAPASKEEFREFVADTDLHIGLSEEWYEIHQSRGWVDRDGVPIKNWKGAVTNYCRAKEKTDG